jgi:hypothetical protein
MSTPTFELDRSPAAFIATLEVDSPDDAGTGTAMALVSSPPSACASEISHQLRSGLESAASGSPGIRPERRSGTALSVGAI